MATTQALAARRAKALARLIDAATIVAVATGQELPAPPANKDPEIARIALMEYAAAVIEAAAATLAPDPTQNVLSSAPAPAPAPDRRKPSS